MIEDDLDDIIRNKFQGHEENYDANSWSSLLEKMDQIDLNAEESFDEVVKEKLTEHQEQYDQASWTQLSSKMDEIYASADGAELGEIKKKLETHEESVIESHWQILKAELEALEHRRYRLWITKSIEAVIILLLLWTFTNFSPIFAPEQIAPSSIPLDYVLDDSYDSEEFWASNKALSPIDGNIDGRSYDNVVNGRDIVIVEDNINSTNENGGFDEVIEYITSSSNGTVNGTVLSGSTGNLIINQVRAEKASDDIHLSEITTTERLEGSYGDLVSLDIGLIRPFDVLLDHDHPTSDLTTFDQTKDKSYRHKNDGWWFGANYSADINLINSGFNLGFVTSQLSSGLLGHTGGLSLSFQKGIVEIQSGFRLSTKAHSPGLLRSFTQASDFSVLEHNLELIEFTQAQIPLVVKLHALNSSRSHIYGFVGVSGNTILGYDFTIEKTIQPSARVRPTDFDASIVDLTDLPEGFAQGGPIRYNTNFTGVIGFGVESSIGQKVSFFVQPQYQHQFGGALNNYVSRIGTISVETGVKLKF